MNLRVPMVPWVSYHTITFTVRYVPIPIMGMVFVGTGAVLDFPTRGIPVPNPMDGASESFNRFRWVWRVARELIMLMPGARILC